MSSGYVIIKTELVFQSLCGFRRYVIFRGEILLSITFEIEFWLPLNNNLAELEIFFLLGSNQCSAENELGLCFFSLGLLEDALVQQLPGCRALLPSFGLTKINIPCLSAWPSTSAFPDLVPVTLSRLFWNVVTSHFCKTTSDHLLHVILSNRTAGRPRPGCNPSKLLTESLLGTNISP